MAKRYLVLDVPFKLVTEKSRKLLKFDKADWEAYFKIMSNKEELSKCNISAKDFESEKDAEKEISLWKLRGNQRFLIEYERISETHCEVSSCVCSGGNAYFNPSFTIPLAEKNTLTKMGSPTKEKKELEKEIEKKKEKKKQSESLSFNHYSYFFNLATNKKPAEEPAIDINDTYIYSYFT